MPVARSKLRMSDEELARFLSSERTARLATTSPDGEPHVVPMWFVWKSGAMYFNSLKRSRRARDIDRGSRVAACVDAGHEYGELHGAVLYGELDSVVDPEESAAVRKAFGDKYWNGIDIPEVKSHEWFRLEPDRIVSWDFEKIPQGRDRRLEASEQDASG